MNCDQAFDCLTDPIRRHSPQLEEHLAQCARCQQMHDTLEPALDMFDELIPEPDLSNGGIATQTLAPDTVRVAEQAAARLQSAGGDNRRRNLILRYAAAAMVGALLMGVMGSINRVDSAAVEDVPIGNATVIPPAPSSLPPAGMPESEPVPEGVCVFASQKFDREAYPTPTAVVRMCAGCHREADEPNFPRSAQPISIEGPVEEDEEAADFIVRTLSLRRHSLRLVDAERHANSGFDRLA